MRFRLYHVGISVGDLDAMTAWYADASGFTAKGSFEVERADLHGSLLTHESGPEPIERAGSKAVGVVPDPPAAAPRLGNGHVALEVDDLNKSFGHLIPVGAKEIWSPRPAPVAGSRMSYVADPVGNMTKLVSLL